MDKKNSENIELSLPTNSVYVSAARLTASNIAYRMGFLIDDIEDIKIAVSEACAFIIKKSFNTENNSFKITFNLLNKSLEIGITLEKGISISSYENEMSINMIKALVDTFIIDDERGVLNNIKIIKRIKANLLESMEV